MRCSGCATELPSGAVFCGICGRPVAAEGAEGADGGDEGAAAGDATPSLLDMIPQNRSARAAKVGLVLALDVGLAVAGVGMIRGYWGGRAAVAATTPASPTPTPAPDPSPSPLPSPSPSPLTPTVAIKPTPT